MRILTLFLFVFTLPSVCAGQSGADDSQFVIGKRAGNDSSSKQARFSLHAKLKDDAYRNQALEIARALIQSKLSDDEAYAIEEALRQDSDRAGKTFATFLDFQKYDPTVRAGSLRALEISESKNSAVGKALAASVLVEPVPETRKAAIALIKKRKDTAAGSEILRYWQNSYDSDLGFDEPKRLAAANAMRDIGDRRFFQAMLAYVTLEIRAGAVTNANVGQANITGPGPINLPIDLPSLDTMSVQGVIIVPAASTLKQITGQDFGKNVNKWRDWINQQPEFQK